MVNIYGQRFDLMKAGRHVLVNIPRGADHKKAMLRVDAESKCFGDSCAELYFTNINITGSWVPVRGGLLFSTRSSHKVGGAVAIDNKTRAVAVSKTNIAAAEAAKKFKVWHHFGTLDIKIAEGTTKEGDNYLNFFVRNLHTVTSKVGGLLGGDDHTAVAAPPAGCRKTVAL